MHAGITILSYFSEVLQNKYRPFPGRISIHRDNLAVVLTIETESGELERIEALLTDYIDVIRGKRSPNEILNNEREVLLLENQREYLKIMLKSEKRILSILKEENSELRSMIKSNDSRFNHLMTMLERSVIPIQAEREFNAAFFHEVTKGANKTAQSAIKQIERLLTRNEEFWDQAATEAKLRELKRDDPGTFEKFHRKIVEGALQGAAGNFLYNMLIHWPFG